MHEERYLSKHALMECDSAVTGLGQDVREGKGSVSCNYRGSLSGGLGLASCLWETSYLSMIQILTILIYDLR